MSIGPGQGVNGDEITAENAAYFSNGLKIHFILNGIFKIAADNVGYNLRLKIVIFKSAHYNETCITQS